MAIVATENSVADVESLFRRVEAWIHEKNALNGSEGWRSRRDVVWSDPYKRPGVEDINGLILETDDGERVHLEPLGDDEQGRPIVELYAWPTLIRVRLRAKANDQWEIETDMGVPFRQPWNRETFVNLVHDLLTTK